MKMNVYMVVEKVRDHDNEGPDEKKYVEQNLFILAQDLHEVSEMVKPSDALVHDRTIDAIRLVCPVTELDGQKYTVRPCTESDWARIETEHRTEDAMALLETTEALLRSVKHSLVRRCNYDDASAVRQAQRNVRVLLGNPTSLEEFFLEQAGNRMPGSLKEAHDRIVPGDPEEPSLTTLKLFAWAVNREEHFSLDQAVKWLDDKGHSLKREDVRSFLDGMVEEHLLAHDMDVCTREGNPWWRIVKK